MAKTKRRSKAVILTYMYGCKKYEYNSVKIEIVRVIFS